MIRPSSIWNFKQILVILVALSLYLLLLEKVFIPFIVGWHVTSHKENQARMEASQAAEAEAWQEALTEIGANPDYTTSIPR